MPRFPPHLQELQLSSPRRCNQIARTVAGRAIFTRRSGGVEFLSHDLRDFLCVITGRNSYRLTSCSQALIQAWTDFVSHCPLKCF